MPLPLFLSFPLLSFFRLFSLSRNPTESDREGLSGILRQIQTFLKVIFFNQRLLKESYLDFVRAFLESIFLSLSLSFLHFSLPVTHPFPSVPSSFVWRVIKLATSDSGFNWFRSVCVECKRTRHVAPFCRYISEWYIMLQIFPRDWPRDKKYFKMYIITHGYEKNSPNKIFIQIDNRLAASLK